MPAARKSCLSSSMTLAVRAMMRGLVAGGQLATISLVAEIPSKIGISLSIMTVS